MIELPLIDCLSPKCGACCMEQSALPLSWYSKAMGNETAHLPFHVVLELDGWLSHFNTHGWPDAAPCIWLDQATMQCKHYEHRPDICRDEVKPGDEACLGWRDEYPVKGPTQ